MVRVILLHFDAFFVHFDKLIRRPPGPLWGVPPLSTKKFLANDFPLISEIVTSNFLGQVNRIPLSVMSRLLDQVSWIPLSVSHCVF